MNDILCSHQLQEKQCHAEVLPVVSQVCIQQVLNDIYLVVLYVVLIVRDDLWGYGLRLIRFVYLWHLHLPEQCEWLHVLVDQRVWQVSLMHQVYILLYQVETASYEQRLSTSDRAMSRVISHKQDSIRVQYIVWIKINSEVFKVFNIGERILFQTEILDLYMPIVIVLNHLIPVVSKINSVETISMIILDFARVHESILLCHLLWYLKHERFLLVGVFHQTQPIVLNQFWRHDHNRQEGVEILKYR